MCVKLGMIAGREDVVALSANLWDESVSELRFGWL